MKTFLFYAPFLLLAALATSPAIGEVGDDAISEEDLPRIAATEPEDALETFELDPAFRLVLAAHEPDVCDPIAMTFDEKGRAYVLEMRGYSERREEALGRVRLLTDTDGDGIFDDSVIFREGLRWPTAITCYKGGVFVGATPDLFYFRDNDGDGVADEEKTVFTGFGGGNPRLNMQALFNSLRWGPDNRIWGATAANGGNVTRPDDPSFGPVSLRRADFSFDPEKLDLRPENGTAQYGMSFDSFGRRFVCSNSRHLIHVAYERHHVKENPFHPLPPALADIPVDGSAAPVYRISPDEPWRIVRTRWRVAGVVPGIVEGGGRVSGYFTSATGVHLYWGEAFGPGFRNNAFIGDVGSNLVHRKVISTSPGQAGLEARRPETEAETEFLRSRDNWFRPTSFATGPDGCLYLTDMYREVIEHPWSIPEPIKSRLDLNSGFERGRIYRIEPADFEREAPRDLGQCSSGELRELAGSRAQWHQVTARRLLFERELPIPPKEPVEPFPAILSSETPLHALRERAVEDRWVRAAYLNSLRTPADVLAAWKLESTKSEGELRRELLLLIGKRNDPEVVRDVILDLSGENLSPALVEDWQSLFAGLPPETGNQLRLRIEEESNPLLSGARALLRQVNPADPPVAAIRLLSFLGNGGDRASLRKLFLESESAELRSELVEAIGDPGFLLENFSLVPDGLRPRVEERILRSRPVTLELLARIRNKSIEANRLAASTLEALRNHRDEEIRTLAEQVLPALATRESVIQSFQPALALAPDVSNGKAVFAKLCVSCHQSRDGQGVRVGPDTITFSAIGAEALLTRILDPGREVAPQYQPYLFTMKDGIVLSGMIAEESPTTVHLLLPGGIRESFPREQVASMKGLGVSLMPEGLEATLSHQDMADLIGFLESESPE